MEVLAVLFVIGVAATALLSAVSSGMRAVYRQSAQTVLIIQERNAKAHGYMQDPETK